MATAGLVQAIHSALIRPSAHPSNRSTAFGPSACGMVGASQKSRTAARCVGLGQRQMAGQHVGQPAHLAPAHRVGLSGDGERAHAQPPDAARREMAVEDRVDLVGPLTRLVDALAEDGDDLLGPGPDAQEGVELGGRQARLAGCRARRSSAVVEACDMGQHPFGVDGTRVVEMGQQAVEQRDIAARCHAPDADRRYRRWPCGVGRCTMRIPARAARAAAMRWYRTGWHQARLEPTSTTRSACSRSS